MRGVLSRLPAFALLAAFLFGGVVPHDHNDGFSKGLTVEKASTEPIDEDDSASCSSCLVSSLEATLTDIQTAEALRAAPLQLPHLSIAAAAPADFLAVGRSPPITS